MESKSSTATHQPSTRLLWAVLVVSAAIGWFYWYQWRPSRIRASCAKEAGKSATELFDSMSGWRLADKMETTNKQLGVYYNLCLNKHGVTK